MNDDKKDINIEGDVNAGNANFGTQHFHGTVNIHGSASTEPPFNRKTSVFISYARADAMEFAKRLHDDLETQGIDAWLDKSDIKDGMTFIEAIDIAIEACDYFILVFTPGANKSEYCRDEWKKALEYYKPIIPLLLLGDYKDLPKEAFVYLNNSPDFRNKASYTSELKKLIKNISDLPSLPGETRNVPKILDYSPRPQLINTMQEALTSHKTSVADNSSNKIGIGIHGMGGVGKSTLAIVLADEYFIRRTFKDGIFWLTIGTEPRLNEIWSQLADYLGHPRDDFKDADDAKAFFELYTRDKECLFILDDLWKKEHADAFLNFGAKSRILASSRRADILAELELVTLAVDEMNNAQAQDLLKRVTKLDTLPAIANEVIKACGYLPLALKMIGSMVVKGGSKGIDLEKRWQDALERLLNPELLVEITGEYRSDIPPTLFAALKVSIDDLDNDLCESYFSFAVFSDDAQIPEDVMLTFWKPLEGRKVRDRINELVSRNLLKKADNGSLTLHDLQFSYLRGEAQERLKQLHSKLLNAYQAQGNGEWYDVPDDGYFYDHLIYHLEQSQQYDEIHSLFCGEGGKGWADKRTLPKLLQDFDYVKKLVPENDIANRIRYAIFDEILRNRYPQMPIEIASQLVIRGLVSPELMVSAIEGMDGDTKDKVNAYITVIKQLDLDITQERLALDALILAKNISDSQDRASLILELYTYLSESNKQNNFNLLWQAAIEIDEWRQRESLFEMILSKLSYDQIDEMKNDLFASNVSARRYVYIFEEIKTYLSPYPEIINEIGSFVLDKVIQTYQQYEKIYLLDYLIKLLPEALQKKAKKNIVPAYLACVVWEPENNWGQKNCFETLIPWIPIEDLPELWERAIRDVALNDGGFSWYAEKVQLAIAKHWGSIDKDTYQHITGENEVPDFVQSIDVHNLAYDNKIPWCEIKARTISLLPKDEQEKEWLFVCEVAIEASWYNLPKGQSEPINKWLDEFTLSIPTPLVPKVWERTLEAFDELLLKRESERNYWNWSSSFHPGYYVGALASLANRIPDEELTDYIQKTISLWIKHHDYSNEWSKTIARLLDRLDNAQRELVWGKLVKIALSDEAKKPFIHSGQDFLFHIVGASSNIVWQDEKIEWLLETSRTQYEETSWRLLYNFSYLPAKFKPNVWLEAVQRLKKGDSDRQIFQCFEEIYPKILEDIPNFPELINWDISLWDKTIVEGRRFGGYTGFNNLLQHAPHNFRVAASQLIKSEDGNLTLEDNIRLFEFVTDDERKEILHKLADTWREETIKELTPLAVASWTPKTIWMVWQYMHDFNPDREWPYCNWALTLAPYIPEEHAAQAYVMALQHLGWPLWKDTCQVLATRVPRDFADSEWNRLTEVLNSGSYDVYGIKKIRSAITSSLSDKKLKQILDNHREQKQTRYKKIAKHSIIDGSLLRYFQSMFLISATARIHELSNLENESKFWRFVISFHRKFDYVVSWGAFIYGGFLAFTFPIMLPIIRALRPIDNVLCLSYPFYIAINLESVARYGYLRDDLEYEYFRSHKTLLMRLYELVDRKIDNEENLNKNSVKGTFYLALIMVLLFFVLFERKVVFRILMLIGALIGVVLFPAVWLLQMMIAVGFIDYYTVNQFFERAIESHLSLSKTTVAEESLEQWLTQSKAPDMLEYRPLLNKIGGSKLRKAVAKAYTDANTWWYETVTVIEEPRKR